MTLSEHLKHLNKLKDDAIKNEKRATERFYSLLQLFESDNPMVRESDNERLRWRALAKVYLSIMETAFILRRLQK